MLEGSLASVKILAVGTDTTVRGRSKCILMFKMTEDEMVRWHHRLNGCEFEQTPADLPDPVIQPRSSALQTDSLPAELPGKT